MAALSTLALAAVAGAKTFSQYSGARQAASEAEARGNFEAGQLRTNASLAEAQAADAVSRGGQEAERVDAQTRTLTGAQRTAFAGQGVDVSRGSAADVQANDRQLGALDAITIRNNAARAAWGFNVQASSFRSQADFAQRAGENQARAFRSQATSTLLGGASDLLNIWSSAPKGVSGGSGSFAPAQEFGANAPQAGAAKMFAGFDTTRATARSAFMNMGRF